MKGAAVLLAISLGIGWFSQSMGGPKVPPLTRAEIARALFQRDEALKGLLVKTVALEEALAAIRKGKK